MIIYNSKRLKDAIDREQQQATRTAPIEVCLLIVVC